MNDETTPPFTQEKTITEVTTSTGKPKRHDSHIMGLSVRSIVVLVIVGTVCYMSVIKLKIEEPLYTLVGMCMGYYFGQNNQNKQQKP